jgi:predicted kinase
MNMILFTGIQATGKSEFYKRYFSKTHIRINLDMLKTRHRERILIEACLMTKQPFVVDNMNLTAAGRKQYIDNARKYGFEVVGYYFKSAINEAITRNNRREGKEKLPLPALRSAHSKLELPFIAEGYDKLFYVYIEYNDFIIEKYRDDI